MDYLYPDDKCQISILHSILHTTADRYILISTAMRSMNSCETYMKLHPFVQQASFIEFKQQARLGDNVCTVTEGATTTRYVTKKIVPVLTEDP